MKKMTLSAGFQKFAAKTTKGKFDEVRKAESRASGCPLPIGVTGIAVISDIVGKETKAEEGKPSKPLLMVKLDVESPEEHQGVSLSGSGLMWTIGASEKRTEEEAWQSMLDDLERLGLPREIRTSYENFQEVIDYFTKNTCRVQFSVDKDTWTGNRSGKRVNAYAYQEEGNAASADDDVDNTTPTKEGAEYVMFLGKKHEVLKNENGMLTLKSPSGREREVDAKSPEITWLD